jgi:hypothetical protein
MIENFEFLQKILFKYYFCSLFLYSKNEILTLIKIRKVMYPGILIKLKRIIFKIKFYF